MEFIFGLMVFCYLLDLDIKAGKIIKNQDIIIANQEKILKKLE